jgi:hypothetical protein
MIPMNSDASSSCELKGKLSIPFEGMTPDMLQSMNKKEPNVLAVLKSLVKMLESSQRN